VDVSVGQTDVVAATTDDDRVVERGATAIGAPTRQVSHRGVGVVSASPAWENKTQTKSFHRQSNNNHPFVIPPAQFLYRRTKDRPAVWVP
jgi:hypothetical protein